AVQGAKAFLVGVGERGRAEQRAVRERDQPFDLDLDAGAVEARLRQVLAELAHRGAVAAVERAQGLRRKSHGGSRRSRSTTADRRYGAALIAGSSCRKSARLALSII